jgi:RNA polymerase sigma-70 factor (ECF subfamily)
MQQLMATQPTLRDLNRTEEVALDLEILVPLAQKKNEQAIETLLRQWESTSRSFLRSRGVGAVDADDIWADIQVEVIRSIETLVRPLAFPKWLRVISERCLNAFWERKHNTHKLHESLAQSRTVYYTVSGELTPVEQRQAQKEQAERVRMEVDALPEKESVIIKCYYFLSLPLKAIAHRLKIPLGTVKSRKNSAETRLRDKLSTYGEMSTSGISRESKTEHDPEMFSAGSWKTNAQGVLQSPAEDRTPKPGYFGWIRAPFKLIARFFESSFLQKHPEAPASDMGVPIFPERTDSFRSSYWCKSPPNGKATFWTA